MTAWSGRSVFVTGGAGFLGSHLVRGLVEAGARVSCLVRGDRPRSGLCLADAVERVHGDVADLPRLHAVLRARSIDAIFHLAAQPIVGDAKADPFQTMESNVRGTYCVLEAARLWGGARSILVVTSDKVYSPSTKPPYKEDAPLGGSLPYEASKVASDAIAMCYARTYGLPIGVARMGNLYGPGDLQWSRIVPGTIRSLLRGERPVVRSDGSPLRDYFYVEDAASALLAFGAADLRPTKLGGPCNFGTGMPTRAIDVVRVLIERSGADVEPDVRGSAPGEIQEQWLDCARAAKRFNWSYRIVLAEGLDRTWAWYKENV